MPSSNTPLMTLTEVVGRLKSSPYSWMGFLIITLPWHRITATPKELCELPTEYDFIVKQFLISNPNYFNENITTLKELKQALSINCCTEDEREKIVQQKAYLINTASTGELTRLINHNYSLLKNLAEGLSEEELIQFGKKYAAGNKKNTLKLLNAVDLRKWDSLQKVLLSLLPSLTEKDKESILKQYPIRLAKEIGLIMGLEGHPYEGAQDKIATQMTIQRYENLSSESSEPLVYHLINDYKSTADFYTPVQQHGDLKSIQAGWEEHAFSFHLIRDGNETHLIYVNRGEQYEGAPKDAPNVTVFTFTDPKKMNPLIEELFEALKTEQKTKISQYIIQNLMLYRNTELSQELSKSKQKTGNCTAANANITWHFSLAATEMKKNKLSFSQAYKNTKPAYKNMRIEDRAQAFCDLLLNSTIDSYRQDALTQTLEKLAEKDKKIDEKKKVGPKNIPILLNRLYERNPDQLSKLLKDLCHSNFDIDEAHQERWIKECIAKLNEKGYLFAKEEQLLKQYYKIREVLTTPKLSPQEKIQYIEANPRSINLIPRAMLGLYIAIISERTIALHLSMDAIEYLVENKTKLALSPYTIAKFSAEQISHLIQNKVLSFNTLDNHPSLVVMCLDKLSAEQIINLLQHDRLDFKKLKKYPNLTDKLSGQQLTVLVKNNNIDYADLTENQTRKYCDYIKEELTKVLTRISETTNPEQRTTANSLLMQVREITDLTKLNQLLLHASKAFTNDSTVNNEEHRKRQKTGKDKQQNTQTGLNNLGFFSDSSKQDQQTESASQPLINLNKGPSA